MGAQAPLISLAEVLRTFLGSGLKGTEAYLVLLLQRMKAPLTWLRKRLQASLTLLTQRAQTWIISLTREMRASLASLPTRAAMIVSYWVMPSLDDCYV